MSKRKPPQSADCCRFDHYHKSLAVRPLRGLERLVKVLRRKRNGILFCDTVCRMSDTGSVSKSNTRRAPFRINYETPFPGFLGEPQSNVPNEVADDDLERFRDYGRHFTFQFTPKNGKTFSIECAAYRPLESYASGLNCRELDDTWVSEYLFTIDLSAYMEAGFAVQSPLCDLTRHAPASKRAAPANSLKPTAPRPGVWQWRIEDVHDCTIRAAWMVEDKGPSRTFPSLDLDGLGTELSVNPSLAKDLHNFVNICQIYATDVRSLNAIDHKLVTSKTALWRSLDSIEELAGAELIERTRGKGMIRITPAGEAVLEWWSRYYMRWTPMSIELIGSR